MERPWTDRQGCRIVLDKDGDNQTDKAKEEMNESRKEWRQPNNKRLDNAQRSWIVIEPAGAVEECPEWLK